MPSMRLGTRVAVINDSGEILLSKRSDLGTWELPGGRVDAHELIHESAAREVLEETGLKVEIERPVGLYFQQGRGRTNIVYLAKPIGGALFDKTDETQANQFFAPDNVPNNLYGKFYIDHSYTDKTWLYTVASPRWQLIKLDIQLKWRWIQNLLAGRPEPKFPDIEVYAVGIVWNNANQEKVLQWNGQLPTVKSDGNIALENALDRALRSRLQWEWVTIEQDIQRDEVKFVFQAIAQDTSKFSGDWVTPSGNLALLKV